MVDWKQLLTVEVALGFLAHTDNEQRKSPDLISSPRWEGSRH